MSKLDAARGAYVRSPAIVRRSLAPFLRLLPTSFIYGRTYRKWRSTVARGAGDNEFSSDFQLAALRRLMVKAKGSPFYAELFATTFGASFDPETMTLTDFRQLPVLIKETLAAAGDAMLAVSKGSVDVAHTSGSNGEPPFSFYLDKDRSVREIAFVHQVWSRTGYEPDQAKVVMRGFARREHDGSNHEWSPVLRELRLSVFPMSRADAALYLDLIDQRAIRYLYGYPSALETFARHLSRLGRRPKLPLLGILPISEPLYAHQRRLFRDIFGEVAVAPFYGLSEKTLFAAELPGQPDVYEFNPLYGVAELIADDGLPVTRIGQEGRLVGTGFVSTGMPFIRYDSQDRAKLVQLPDTQNGQRLRVTGIMPRRKPDFLISRDGDRIVAIDLTPEDPAFFEDIEGYQFYQDTPGRVVIKYVATPGHGDEGKVERIRGELSQMAEGKLDFVVQRVDGLEAPGSGKRAYIDQRLNISDY
jgi:phenylacetate-coenzyme A ligase PaaK-like adenylate-forming protein